MIGLVVIIVALGINIPTLSAQENQQASPAAPRARFIDANRDGINDRFYDANGDGINDVDGQPYPHHFSFVDANNDGINDRFRDVDGDGVNDLQSRYVDADGDGFIDNIIDEDRDGINDITGEKYDHRGLRGWRFGRVFEERRHLLRRFVDQNGDGMHDALERLNRRRPIGERGFDFFLDEDGDGIDDTRMLRGQQRPLERPLLRKHPLQRRPMPPRLRNEDPEREEKHRRGRRGGRK